MVYWKTVWGERSSKGRLWGKKERKDGRRRVEELGDVSSVRAVL